LVELLKAGDMEGIGKILSVVTGVAGWMYASTGKWSSTSSNYTFKARFFDAVADTFGAGTAKALSGGTYTGSADFSFSPFGFINQITFGGVALLVADSLADGIDNYRMVSPIIQGIGWGLTLGGIIGGLFDPPSAGGPQGTQVAPLPEPYVRAYNYAPHTLSSSSALRQSSIPTPSEFAMPVIA
jgi:hypothetical protein